MSKTNSISKNKSNFSAFYNKFGIFIVLAVLIVFCSIISESFFSSNNIINILRQNAIIAIIACGAQLVLLCGEVDLSPGSVAAVAGCVTVMLVHAGCNVVAAIAGGLIIGGILGFLNGFIITHGRIPSFIMTLATQQIARGAILVFTNGQPIYGVDNLAWCGQGYVAKVIPAPVVFMIIIVLLTWFILNRLSLGRFFYAVGGNIEAAKASGINASLVKTVAFIYAGITAALGGIILMARIDSGQPAGGDGYEFDAITAVIIGGTSMSGGVGNIYGTFAGALFVGVLKNIMTLTNVSSYWQQIAQGAIIALAVIIDVRIRASKKN